MNQRIPIVTVENLLVISSLSALLLQRSTQFADIALYLVLVATTYLTDRCITPPNPNPTKPKAAPASRTIKLGVGRKASLPADTIRFVTSQACIVAVRAIFYILGLYHALLVLNYTSLSQKYSQQVKQSYSSLCAHPYRLNHSLFSWTPHAIICIISITVGATLRLSAYRQLGKNFTFRLAEPSELVTTGLYSWVRHPSYTAGIIAVSANIFLYWQSDGVAACWLPEHLARNSLWTSGLYILVATGCCGVVLRVGDEEKMLETQFGRKYDEWRRKTWKFVPFVL